MAKPKIKPLNDKILVKRTEAEDAAKEKPKEGTVLALGDGKLLDDGQRALFQVKVGDRILFTSYAGTDIKIDGEEYMILGEDDILAVID